VENQIVVPPRKSPERKEMKREKGTENIWRKEWQK
jgi:hypothetical protein